MPQNHIHVHPRSGKLTFLSIPSIYYNAQNPHTCTHWKWKSHVSFHSFNITMAKFHIQVHPRSGKHTFLSIPPYITMPKIHIHVHPGNEKLTLLSICPIYYNAQNHMYILEVESSRFFPFHLLQCSKIAYMYIMKCKAQASFHSSHNAQKIRYMCNPGSGTLTFVPIDYNAQKSHTCTSWEWNTHVFFPFLQFITMTKNHIRGSVKNSLQPSFFSSHGCIYTKMAVSTTSMNICLSCHVTWIVLHAWLHYGISIKTMHLVHCL